MTGITVIRLLREATQTALPVSSLEQTLGTLRKELERRQLMEKSDIFLFKGESDIAASDEEILTIAVACKSETSPATEITKTLTIKVHQAPAQRNVVIIIARGSETDWRSLPVPEAELSQRSRWASSDILSSTRG